MEGVWRLVVDLLTTAASITVILAYFGVTKESWDSVMPLSRKWTLLLMLSLMCLSLGLSGYAFYRARSPILVEKIVDRPVDRVVEKLAPQECPKCTESKRSTPQVSASGPNSGAVGKLDQGPCSSANIGGSFNSSTVNCPPPLTLTATLAEIPSDNLGEIKTLITIVPNLPVSAPFKIALDFDNPVSSMGWSVADAGAMLGGGPFRNGIHAMTTVGTGFNQTHPLLVTVISEKSLKLTGPPRIE